MTAITLPPELERFVGDAVAAGRFRDKPDLIRAAIALLRRVEADRTSLIESLEQAEADAERHGFCDLGDVERDMERVIEAALHREG